MPLQVVLCHCTLCQRRTGSSYNLSAWYPAQSVSASGEARQFTRQGDHGGASTYHFCPHCGTSLWWALPAAMGELVAVAVGGFAEPGFPAPTLALYDRSRHHWLTPPTDIPTFTGFIDDSPLT